MTGQSDRAQQFMLWVTSLSCWSSLTLYSCPMPSLYYTPTHRCIKNKKWIFLSLNKISWNYRAFSCPKTCQHQILDLCLREHWESLRFLLQRFKSFEKFSLRLACLALSSQIWIEGSRLFWRDGFIHGCLSSLVLTSAMELHCLKNWILKKFSLQTKTIPSQVEDAVSLLGVIPSFVKICTGLVSWGFSVVFGKPLLHALRCYLAGKYHTLWQAEANPDKSYPQLRLQYQYHVQVWHWGLGFSCGRNAVLQQLVSLSSQRVELLLEAWLPYIHPCFIIPSHHQHKLRTILNCKTFQILVLCSIVMSINVGFLNDFLLHGKFENMQLLWSLESNT